MKTGLESLDIGAPKITYSGNEGPQSPQETQQKMAEFELQEYMEEFEKVFPEMKELRGTQEYMDNLEDYFQGLASKQNEGIGNLAMADPLLEEEYQKYVFEMEEQGLQPMSLEEFRQQAMSNMADGGRIGLYQGGGPHAGGYGPSGSQGPAGGQSSGGDYGGGNDGGNNNNNNNANSGLGRQDQMGGKPGFTAAQIRAADPIGYGGGNPGDNVTASQLKEIIKQEQDLLNRPFEIKDTPSPLLNMGLKLFEGALSKGDKINRQFFIDKVLGSKNYTYSDIQNLLEEDDISTIEDIYSNYMQSRMAGTIDAYGNPIGGGDGPQRIAQATGIPAISSAALNTTPINTAATTAAAATSNPFIPATNFNEYDVDQANKNTMIALGVDPTMFAADGGRIGYAGGGIADLRQGYFLGKLVKKATRAVKKIAKSPIGKAALLAGGAGLLGFGPAAGLRSTSLGNFLMGTKGAAGQFTGGLLRKAFLKNPATAFSMENISPFRTIGLASLLPFIMPQEEEDNLDEYTTSRRGDFNPFAEFGGVSGLRRNVLAGGLNRGDFAFMAPQFYAADGGLAENRMAALNQIYGINDDDEEQKLSMGGSAGLPPITQATNTVDTKSFGDDETTGIAQATPQNQMPMPMPMPMRSPMMSPMMARSMNPMMMRSMNPMMMRSMNPMMMRNMNSMMARGMPMMGGRIMAQEGGMMMASTPDPMDEAFQMYKDAIEKGLFNGTFDDFLEKIDEMRDYDKTSAVPRIMAQEGGMMDMGGMEKDYRNEGGFVAIGGKERADDVPARLSKNEFVFTADAVRNAGGGDIDKGAEIMENMMENLEAGGKVSKASQGLEGARSMFATQQRLEEVL